MPKTDAQRRATRKWDSAHMLTLQSKVKRETAEDFRRWCEASGTTVSAELARHVADCLSRPPRAAEGDALTRGDKSSSQS